LNRNHLKWRLSEAGMAHSRQLAKGGQTMTTKDETLKSAARRNFFKTAGKGVAGAAALGVVASTATAAEKPPGNYTAGDYRETDHVKAAYRTARF
jgi:hypothetical protein